MSSVACGQLVIDGLDVPAEQGRLLVAQATILDRQGQSRAAQQVAMEAERLAARAAERTLVAWARRLQARALGTLGLLEEALVLARSSATLYDSIGALEQGLHSRGIVALTLWRMGRFAASITLHRSNLAEAYRLRQPGRQAHILVELGAALALQGELDEAEGHLLTAATLAASLDDQYVALSIEYHLANLWNDRAFLLSCSGDSQAARMMQARGEVRIRFQRTITLAQEHQREHMVVFGAIDLAVALAHWGELDEAKIWIALAQQTLQQGTDNVAAQGWTHISVAEVSLAEGEPDTALVQITEALLILETAAPAALTHAHHVAALCYAALGKPDLAISHWEASLREAAHRGQLMEKRRTLRAQINARQSYP